MSLRSFSRPVVGAGFFSAPLVRSFQALLLAFITQAAHGQTYEWDGGGANMNWSTGLNWVGDAVPPTNADYLFSDASGLGLNTLNLDADRVVNSLTYDGLSSYTISGANALTFGNTGVAGLPSITLTDDATGAGPTANHEINVPVTIAELLTINNNSTDNLTFNGNITNTGGIAIYGAGGTSFDGASLTGNGAIDKYGAGTLFLRRTNSAASTEHITVHEGILSAPSGNSIANNPGTAGMDVLSGASLEAEYQGQINIPLGGLRVNGNGVHYALQGDVGAIYAAPGLDGGEAQLSTSSKVIMQGDTSFGAFAGSTLLLFGGEITDKVNGTGANQGFDFIKVGQGVVSISNATATWSGDTIVKEGAFVGVSPGDLPGGFGTPTSNPNPSRLILDGGVYGLSNAGSFTRSVGTAANQVFWTGDGGFADFIANGLMTVNLGGAATPTGLTWGPGGFVPTDHALVLGDEMATGYSVVFENPIALGAQTREIRAIAGDPTLHPPYPGDNSGYAYGGVMTGELSGSGGINKTGDGVLALVAANTYTGETRISGGALSLQGYQAVTGYTPGSINNSHIVFDGGVFMPPVSPSSNSTSLPVTYTPTLGTAAGNVSWDGDGGFAAYSQQATTVRLNNDATTPLVWGGTPNFLGDGDTLILGSPYSQASVTLDNAIDLNSGNRSIRVDDSKLDVTVNPDAILSQNISGSGVLNVTGNGQIAMRAANTTTANINVEGATLLLDGTTGALNSAGTISIAQGGTLIVNSATTEIQRLNDSSTVHLGGGTLDVHADTSMPIFAETIAGITLDGGSNDVILSGNNTVLASTGALTRTDHGTVDFRPSTVGDGGGSAMVTFATAPTLTGGILPYATVNGTDFATYGANGIDAAASSAPIESGLNSTVNYKSGSLDMTADHTVNSLNLNNNSTLSGAGTALTVASGGILANMGANDSTISVDTLKSGTNELIVHANDSAATTLNTLNISSSIQNGTAGATTLVKTGNGNLTLSGTTANTYTGDTVIQEGTMILAKTGTAANSVAVPGNVIVGDGAGADVLQINNSNQFSTSTTITLNGGDPNNAGAGTATFRFNGQATEGSNLPALTATIDTLGINQSGVLDFSGGLNDAPNYLYLDQLLMASPDSMLTVANWREFKDYFLIKDTSNFPDIASRIHFDGYEGTSNLTRYSDDYWAITPLGLTAIPEPSTVGLISLFTLGLLGRRKRVSSGGKWVSE